MVRRFAPIAIACLGIALVFAGFRESRVSGPKLVAREFLDAFLAGDVSAMDEAMVSGLAVEATHPLGELDGVSARINRVDVSDGRANVRVTFVAGTEFLRGEMLCQRDDALWRVAGLWLESREADDREVEALSMLVGRPGVVVESF